MALPAAPELVDVEVGVVELIGVVVGVSVATISLINLEEKFGFL